MNTNYLCESKLKNDDPQLHLLFANSVFCVQRLLLKYQNVFPTFTDHTALHSMEVIDFCNALIANQIDRLNADEIYVLLMSAYLHDSGMGISQSDFREFSKQLDLGEYANETDENKIPDIIRMFHHEFSGQYIRKYGDVFEIPSKEHLFAIVQVSRGHRKTDLYDEQQYPSDFVVPNGNHICIPYLAALIRLADELDVAADRNSQLLYDIDSIATKRDQIEFRKHEAVRRLVIEEDAFVLHVHAEDEFLWQEILKLRQKLDDTLQQCRKVVEDRTSFTITQKEIQIERVS